MLSWALRTNKKDLTCKLPHVVCRNTGSFWVKLDVGPHIGWVVGPEYGLGLCQDGVLFFVNGDGIFLENTMYTTRY